jgi:hypothetical protein
VTLGESSPPFALEYAIAPRSGMLLAGSGFDNAIGLTPRGAP